MTDFQQDNSREIWMGDGCWPRFQILRAALSSGSRKRGQKISTYSVDSVFIKKSDYIRNVDMCTPLFCSEFFWHFELFFRWQEYMHMGSKMPFPFSCINSFLWNMLTILTARGKAIADLEKKWKSGQITNFKAKDANSCSNRPKYTLM
jgi:hypothetical protein